MPVHEVRKNGRLIGFQWGSSGKIYTVARWGKAGAAKKAYAQESAAKHNGYKE
jgi:hypothetical protein